MPLSWWQCLMQQYGNLNAGPVYYIRLVMLLLFKINLCSCDCILKSYIPTLLYIAVCSTPLYFSTSCKITCKSGTFGRTCAGNCSVIGRTEHCQLVSGCPAKSSIIPQRADSDVGQLYKWFNCMCFFLLEFLRLNIIICICRRAEDIFTGRPSKSTNSSITIQQTSTMLAVIASVRGISITMYGSYNQSQRHTFDRLNRY